jgi:hypothetical protein
MRKRNFEEEQGAGTYKDIDDWMVGASRDRKVAPKGYFSVSKRRR